MDKTQVLCAGFYRPSQFCSPSSACLLASPPLQHFGCLLFLYVSLLALWLQLLPPVPLSLCSPLPDSPAPPAILLSLTLSIPKPIERPPLLCFLHCSTASAVGIVTRSLTHELPSVAHAVGLSQGTSSLTACCLLKSPFFLWPVLHASISRSNFAEPWLYDVICECKTVFTSPIPYHCPVLSPTSPLSVPSAPPFLWYSKIWENSKIC